MRKYLADLTNNSSQSFWKKVPISGYLFLLLVITGIILLQLKPGVGVDKNSHETILYHFTQRFIWISILAVLLFAFLTVFIAWIFWKKRKQAQSIQLRLDIRDDHRLKIHLKAPLKPIGGSLRARLYFDQESYTTPLILMESVSDSKAEKGFSTYILKSELPHIAEYQLDKMVLYLCDFIHFFRFPITLEKKAIIIQAPELIKQNNPQIKPMKTQLETAKVLSNRKSPGDLLHFKQYESNDDIRRIVWPLYAKTGELMVRQAEIQSQYVSDALIYASFFSHSSLNSQDIVGQQMLDFYKNVIFTSFQKLKEEEEFSVYLQTDHPSKSLIHTTKEVQSHLANCYWQTQQSLKGLAHKESISLLIVSSLNDVEEVAEWAQNQHLYAEILFVPLSEALAKPSKNAWIRWIFTHRKENQSIWNALRWQISPMRKELLSKEKQLREILSLKKSSLIAS